MKRSYNQLQLAIIKFDQMLKILFYSVVSEERLITRGVLHGFDLLRAIRVRSQDLSLAENLQHDPSPGLRAHSAELPVGVERGGVHRIGQLTRPHRLMRESVPQGHRAVVAAGQELVVRWMHREAPQLVLVSFNDRREVQAQ